ncbi:MAG: hypothetical protein ACI9KE_001651 [Polyangiales bacterium]|jgi:hypothetical protein
MRRCSTGLLCLVLTTLAVRAEAQEPPGISEATSRATAMERCLSPLIQQLQTNLALVREAKTQLRASDEQARGDAARAIVSLEQRVHALSEELQACAPRSAALEPTTRVQELTGAAARVATVNDATQMVERDVQLVANVRVLVGERVDGSGQASHDLVRRAVRSIGAPLQRCYSRMLENGALQAGEAIIAFTIRGSGGVNRAHAEGVTIGGPSFRRCLQRAAEQIRVSGRASGGDARYAYTLRFGS